MAKSTNGNSLLKQVEDGRLNIRAEGYAMSLGELASLYEEGEINISPRFQRFFRWTLDQKSRLIESLLLGIPLPQVFVSQTEEGVWEVVDGLQRLSAVLQFMGRLRRLGRRTVATARADEHNLPSWARRSEVGIASPAPTA